MRPDQLRQLTALAEARKSRDLAELEAAVAEDRRLQEAIEAYAKAPAQDLQEIQGELPLAQMALRMKWADRNIAIARGKRSELAVRIVELRKRAAVSLGKQEALQQLTKRSIREKNDRFRSREEKEAPPFPGQTEG